ncbi:hypothetical protein NLJ89_g11094 [Agrocybe chaxingu]|uniref:Reverse transcriptase Ty1/copia-type domain-containing protein n=1 Tax=Agrocybe chaxingu TaxID=84603 RepID=A0A9W8JXF2_9AGAR|nr:hypothetical protein NLJ89_g11094 [Agrocybe chaxingu]
MLTEDLAWKNLVNGLHITGGEGSPSMCEDCIYGKQTARLYDKHYKPESETLALVHIDLHHPGKVPAEVWTGKRQDVSHLQPFSCTVYAKIPKEVNPSKISPISIKYLLTGYYNCNTYKLFDRHTGKVIKSCDVIFEEGTGHRTLPTTPPADEDDIYDIFGPTSTDVTEDSDKTPGRVNVINPLWTFGYKYDAEGEITKQKAQLVAKGYMQIPGLDFDQTYASVACLESMRMTATVIACKQLNSWQIDYIAAYLNSKNKFEGAYDWEDELSRTYKRLGYYQSHADPCIRHRFIDAKEKAIGEIEGCYEVKRIEESRGEKVILGMAMTQDNLSFTVNLLSWYQANPGQAHWKALQHVLAYINGTLHYKITYDPGSPKALSILGYSDSDYAGDPDTMRSTGSYIFTMAGGPVAWSSKRQATTASSTTEAEYMALNRECQQAVWMREWVSKAQLEQMSPAKIFGDNKGSVDIAKNVKGITKAKHIHVKHHYIHKRVNKGDVEITRIPTDMNVADILTKSLPRAPHKKFVNMLGLASE